ncbi:hypothetical protein D9M68_547880 [compost metagenome]
MPEPVPPTKSTSPRFSITVFSSTSGSLRSSKRGMSSLMFRATMETSLRCLKMLTRKRPTLPTAIARFISSSRSNSVFCSSSISDQAMRATSPAFSGSPVRGLSTPLNFAQGGAPVER